MYKKKYDSLIILIPSFNELINLRKFVKKIHKRYEVLIVDDCSSDDTSVWLKKNKIKFIRNKKKAPLQTLKIFFLYFVLA